MYAVQLLALAAASGLASSLDSRQDGTQPVTCVAQSLQNPGQPSAGCGLKGAITSPNTGQQFTAQSLLDCANGCFQDSYCASFSLAANMTCQLYESTLKQMGYKQAKKGKVAYYSRDCFITQCPNMLSNGDFEDGSWDPWTEEEASSTATISVESPGTNGSSYCGAILLGSGTNEYMTVSQTLQNLVIGQQYLWSFDFMLADDRCLAQWGEHFLTPAGVLTHGHYLTLGAENVTIGEWDSYTVYLTPLVDTVTLTVMTLCNLTDTTSEIVSEYDNFVFSPFPSQVFTPASPTTGRNLVVDGGFESAGLSHYTFQRHPNTEFNVVTPGAAGSAQAGMATLNYNAFIPTILIFQTIDLVPGHTYSLSFAFKANTTTVRGFHAMLAFMSASPKNYFAYGKLVSYNTATQFPTNWTTLFGTFTAPVDKLDVSFEFAGTSVEIFIDNIQIYEISS